VGSEMCIRDSNKYLSVGYNQLKSLFYKKNNGFSKMEDAK